MIRSIGVIAAFLLFLSTSPKFPEDPITRISISDSTDFEVFALYDSLGLLDLYGARVYTPICEGNRCYAVEIDLYWDLTGSFHHYDTLPGHKLTKLDHLPFSNSDYLKLRNILSNPNSVLASYSEEQLVRDTRSSTIDGFTGATISEVKEAVIEGAVYSCHTLWHIAHGSVTDSLPLYTRKMFSKELIQKMVGMYDPQVNYFLIQNFSENDFALYLPEILMAIKQGAGYFAKNAIEKLPSDLLCENDRQKSFADQQQFLDYFARVALLEKLQTTCLSEALEDVLKADLDEQKSYKNELIRKLIL